MPEWSIHNKWAGKMGISEEASDIVNGLIDFPENGVYTSIVQALRQGRLKEPFTKRDFRNACPGWGEGTYNVFLDKHAVGNPGGNSELFIRVAPGKFKLLRPIKYGI